MVQILLLSLALPCAVAATIAGAARLLPAGWWLRRSSALAALAAGYLTAHLAVAGAPALPPVDTTQGLCYLALLATALAAAGEAAGVLAGRLARVAAVASMLLLTLHPMVRFHWSALRSALSLVLLAAASLALWAACRAVASRLGPAVAGSAWVAALCGAATLLLFGRSALLAQLAGSAAAVLLVVTLVSREAASALATLGLLVPLLHALALNGCYYAELSAPAAIALAASPLAGALALTARGRGAPARVVAAAAAVVVLLAPFAVRSGLDYVMAGRGYYDAYGE